MIWMLIIYTWAGFGYAAMIKSLRPLLPLEYPISDIRLAIIAILFWPLMVFVFLFYDGDEFVKDTK